ncbi:Six-hairpin glycosidase-like protein [Lysobacter sp. LF1]|uniref:Six-hairpin glycosidase-like protein n=1 Tax=Lysobacter stagni TaxID=3045172 RepID=A0ABT6XCF1_9GAMM|nr:Six-hairpin glycosidase-like protein [Lysobacter sp. LF1]MDI9237825.1 Six-hairpin glycosidase-like protein [Lysobacter sp. LF1]
MNRAITPDARTTWRTTLAVARLALACGLAVSTGAYAQADGHPWQDGLDWRGHHARMTASPDGWRLRTDAAGTAIERDIAIQPMRSDTASVLFDGLFALAQDELQRAQVASITDNAYDSGRPIPCPCFETGEKWRYVWTRDLSFAADLALARLAPQRTRDSLRFKLSDARAGGSPGTYVLQDTGSGGSWPISSDRVVWFLGAAALPPSDDTDAQRFADQTWSALTATLAQDRQYVFDEDMGLYRGETSFLDWREQSYPRWTADDVGFIGQSFALSTNVLHYRALRLAARLAHERGDARAAQYDAQADALARAIDRRFWRDDRGLYMSYIGTAAHPVPFEAYDLLGLALLIDSGIAPEDRARRALSNYPTLESGSPVIWPQQPGIAIYHNRAIWPFVSAYALRAARRLDDAPRIEHEIRSLMRGAALAASNMENFELTTQAVHVDDGALSGPVVNSPRQLWSVAGYLQMVMEGVFGLQADGSVLPKIPVALVPMLFGERDTVSLQLRDGTIVLHRPAHVDGDLLVAGTTRREGDTRHVQLIGKQAPRAIADVRLDAAAFAPASPDAPTLREDGAQWRIDVPAGTRLYVDGALRAEAIAQPRHATLPRRPAQQCLSLTRVAGGVESLHGPTRCVGDETTVEGAWPRQWRAPTTGRYALSVDFVNTHGPINTGITAAVKRLIVECEGQPAQTGPLVMPHGTAMQRSSPVVIEAKAGGACRIGLLDGFNMSYLSHNAHYTGGAGGIDGPLNAADIGALHVMPLTENVAR